MSATPRKLTPEAARDLLDAREKGFHDVVHRDPQVEDLHTLLQRKNRYKYELLQATLRWVMKHLDRVGLEPDDLTFNDLKG